MNRRPRSIPLGFAVVASILVHLLLAGFFWSLSWRWDRLAATLTEAGGVVWFNLNPGGAGTGGAGGSGAPQEKIAEEASGPEAEQKPQGEKTRDAAAPIPKSKAASPVLVPEKRPEAKDPPSPSQKEKSAGILGPGEGDGSGTKTGSGAGEGSGLGQGEGSGSGSGQGPGGTGALGTGGSGQGGEGNALLAKIRSKIARAKRYPRQARSQGVEGVCGLQFAIRPDGSVEYVKLSQSSGHEILDEEALATVKRAAPFPYYAGPIRFSLRFNLKDL